MFADEVQESSTKSPSVDGRSFMKYNVDAMFDILTDLQTSKWRGEEDRVKLLLSRRAAALGASVGNRACNTPEVVRPSVDGSRLALGEEAIDELETALSEIAAFVLRPERVQRCRIACQKGSFDATERRFAKFLSEIKPIAESPVEADTVETELKSFKPALSKVFVSVPGQTNYCAARASGSAGCISRRSGALLARASLERRIPPP